MKNQIMKFGLILFFSILIFNNHLEKSKFYIIKEVDATRLASTFFIPYDTPLSKEDYFNTLAVYPWKIQVRLKTYTVQETNLFKNKESLIISLLAFISLSLVILTIDLSAIIKNSSFFLVILLASILLYNSIDHSSVVNPNTLGKITSIEDSLDDLKNNMDNLDYRISELEY